MTYPRRASRYDPQAAPLAPQVPNLSVQLARAVRDGHRTLRVCLPGKIVGLESNLRADVQPLLQSLYHASPEPVTLPILPSVPVAMPHGAGFALSYPLSKGDTGLLIFADRSIDTWLAGDGGVADPQDARLHDLTDAIFVPGLLTDGPAATAADASGDLVARCGLAELRLKKGGQVRIGNAGTELVGQVASLTDELTTVVAALGKPAVPGTPPIDPATAAAMVVRLKNIAAALASLKP